MFILLLNVFDVQHLPNLNCRLPMCLNEDSSATGRSVVKRSRTQTACAYTIDVTPMRSRITAITARLHTGRRVDSSTTSRRSTVRRRSADVVGNGSWLCRTTVSRHHQAVCLQRLKLESCVQKLTVEVDRCCYRTEMWWTALLLM